jgi:hypothetical protein
VKKSIIASTLALLVSLIAGSAHADLGKLIINGTPSATAGVSAGYTDVAAAANSPRVILTSNIPGRTPVQLVAHNPIEAQWLVNFFNRTSSQVQLNYSPDPKIKEPTQVDNYIIEIDGEPQGTLDAYTDTLRAYMQVNFGCYFDIESIKTEPKKILGHKLPVPTGWPTNGVLASGNPRACK